MTVRQDVFLLKRIYAEFDREISKDINYKFLKERVEKELYEPLQIH